jgi:putative hydrolase of the HAD superfamily
MLKKSEASTMSSIKLFIFDMGGVVARNTSIAGAIAAHLRISKREFLRGTSSDYEDTRASSYNLSDIYAITQGKINSERFWGNFTQRTGIAVSGDPWYDLFDPVFDKKTSAIITRLKANGYRVVCGTNTIEAHYRKHEERGDYSVFDAVYASHLMGIMKPDMAFWHFILSKEKVLPSEAFFVDDSEENINTAKKAGLATHLFTDAEELVNSLRTYGI